MVEIPLFLCEVIHKSSWAEFVKKLLYQIVLTLDYICGIIRVQRKREYKMQAIDRMKKDLAELVERAKQMEKEIEKIEASASDFENMNYNDLIRYYVKYLAAIEYGYNNKPSDLAKLAEWQKVYAKYKTLRNQRKAEIKVLFENYVSTVKAPLFQEDIVKSLTDDIRVAYETITPFDCEERWYGGYDRLARGYWERRIKNLVTGYMRTLKFRKDRVIIYSPLKKG